jgi:hypothetical protein
MAPKLPPWFCSNFASRWLSAACETAAGCFEVPGCRSACGQGDLVEVRRGR